MPGDAEPEVFWLPAVGHRFGFKPWEMRDVRVSHYDEMLRYLREVPVLG